jgi:alpha-L-rhamnosidase
MRVAPRPGDGITAAEAEHVTPHGLAAVSWRRDGDTVALDVRVPEGCVAEVVLPAGRELEVGPGSHSFR